MILARTFFMRRSNQTDTPQGQKDAPCNILSKISLADTLTIVGTNTGGVIKIAEVRWPVESYMIFNSGGSSLRNNKVQNISAIRHSLCDS